MNVPKLRFGEFEDEWQDSTLGDVSKVTSGGTPNRANNEFWNGSIPWVSTALIDFNVIKEADEFITEDGLNNSSAKLFPKNTLLMAMYGQGKTRGKVAILGIEAATNQACAAIMFNEEVDTNFAFHNLSGRYDEIRELSNAGSQENLSAGLIKELNLSYPQITEQQKIADFLSAVDDKITALTAQKTALTQYKQGMMQRIFSQTLRFKDDNGADYPDWEFVNFGDVFTFKSTNSYSRECLNYEIGATKNIHYGDIHTKFKTLFDITNENVPFVNSDISLDKVNDDAFCRVGDLVIADASEDYKDIGKSIEIINLNNQRVIAGLHTFLARPATGLLSTGFIGYAMQSTAVRLQVMTVAQGTKVLSISAGRLAKVQIPLPKTEEQTKTARFLTELDDKINAVDAQIQSAQQWKQGLLQQMFV